MEAQHSHRPFVLSLIAVAVSPRFVFTYLFSMTIRISSMWEDLAPELVLGIFRHFLSGLKLSVTEPALFPWYLGQICSSWREIFISYPAFWSNFIIHLESQVELQYDFVEAHCTTMHVEVDAHRALAILNTTCLPRSGNFPFSFKLVVYSSRMLKKRGGLQILELLVRQCTRWHDAHIELHESGLPVLYRVKGKLPVLRSMWVNLWVLYDTPHIVKNILAGPPPSTYADLFVNTPQLRCLHVCYHPWTIDLSALTVIHLRYPYYQMSLLQDNHSRFSCLEELNIYGRFKLSLDLDTVPVTLPSIKILRTVFGKALELIRTPMLQELCLTKITELYEPDAPDFHDTLSTCLPSLPHLTKLTLCTNTPGDVEILLQCMPVVSDLCLYACEPNYSGLRIGDPPEHCLRVCKSDLLEPLTECPKARYLKTLTVGLLDCDENRLANITTWMRRKSLQDGVHCFDELEHLSLVFGALPDVHSFGVVKQHLKAEGIQNSIRKLNNEDDSILFDFYIDCDELDYTS